MNLPPEKSHPKPPPQTDSRSREEEEDAASSLTSITLMNKNLHNGREAAPAEERRPPETARSWEEWDKDREGARIRADCRFWVTGTHRKTVREQFVHVYELKTGKKMIKNLETRCFLGSPRKNGTARLPANEMLGMRWDHIFRREFSSFRNYESRVKAFSNTHSCTVTEQKRLATE